MPATAPRNAPTMLNSEATQPAVTRVSSSVSRSMGIAGGTLPTCSPATMPAPMVSQTTSQRVTVSRTWVTRAAPEELRVGQSNAAVSKEEGGETKVVDRLSAVGGRSMHGRSWPMHRFMQNLSSHRRLLATAQLH